jgi:uncharacterized protein (TIGR03437 family)
LRGLRNRAAQNNVASNVHSSANIRFAATLLALCLLIAPAAAQQSHITRAIDNRERMTLKGHLHPKALAENDLGRVSPSMTVSYVTIMLAQTASQQADLDELLAGQQTPGSKNYHRWLTPDEYAQHFGVSEEDLNKIATWARGQGLTVAAVARGRNWISVSGAAAQMEQAFQTELHRYLVDGETHFANAAEPSVPAAMGGVVRAIRGLNDFRAKPAKRVPHGSVAPDYNSSHGANYLAPNDLATIYNMTPLYAAGIDGSGQSLVIAGQTGINLSDIQQFRSYFSLPASDPQTILVPGARDPGISKSDLSEADLDLEWSGAVARNASIIYVYADDVMQAVQYAIDQNLAPVVSISYGLCELETSTSDALAFRSWAKQGNAQGITWFSASGDNGGADCNDSQNPGLAVDLPASVPEVTGVGGTEFQEGGGQYWSPTNDSSRASVLSYIPEMAWNDSAADGSPAATGGGASVVFTKPAWQTGSGVPGDNARHVPDVSLSGSADHDGYMVYTGGSLGVFGGTSVSTPAFAGIAALLNQYLVSTHAQQTAGVGNMNPTLYALAQSVPDVFHDVTAGDNIVTAACSSRNRACSNSPVGYTAGVGYDPATGLGSVDVYNLVTKWTSAPAITVPASTSITLLTNLSRAASTDVVFLIATVTGANGLTPVGTVVFSAGGATLGSAQLVGSSGMATATLVVNGAQLPQGSATVLAAYTAAPAVVSASVVISVTSTGSASGGTPAIGGVSNGASFKGVFAPGMILSVFGSHLAPSTSSAASVPLPITMAGVAVTINGQAAPLYYISPGQLNIQIPYETAAGATATVTINNNGQVASQSFLMAAVAPGIFTDANSAPVPNISAGRGQIVTLFITGAGAVTPSISTGSAPPAATAISDLPAPVQTAKVTVGGVLASIQFIGIPSGLVGVTQINYQVPGGIGLGPQPVVVAIGGVLSAPANLTVTN